LPLLLTAPPALRAGPRAGLMWLAVAVGLGLTVLARGVGLSVAPAPDGVEAALVGQVLALSGAGAGDGSGGLSPAALQVAAWVGATGGWERAPSVLGAAREALLVTSVLTAVLGWALARRLGVDRAWAAAAVLLLAVCPSLIDVQRTATAADMALPWLLGALVLAARARPAGPCGLALDAALVGCAVIATLTAPIALALVPAVLWLDSRHGDPVRTGLLAAATALLAGPGLVLAGAVGGTGLANPAAPGWLGADPVTAVLVVAAALLGLASARLRPLASGLLLAPLVAWTTGTDADGLLGLAVPVALLLLAGLAGQAGHAAQHRPRDLRVRIGSPAGAAVGVVAVLLAWAPLLARLPAGAQGGAIGEARAWVAENGAAAELVLADAPTRLALTSAQRWDRTRTGTAVWPVVAVFGQGPGAVAVRAVPPADLDPGREERARRIAGELLVASPQLEAPAAVQDLLREGRAGPQLVLTLGVLLSNQRIRLVDLPAVAAEEAAGQPRRRLLLQPVDGSAEQILSFYRDQRGPYRPDVAVRTTDGVFLSYPPLPRPGLLDPFLPEGPP
jgi:hypothetical protein